MADQGSKQPENIARTASVEIEGIAKLFRTKTVATADMLFIPLVTSAKRAMAMAAEVSSANPTVRSSSEMLARTYLAGMMLEDPSFVISTNPVTEEDRYVLDVGAGKFYARMWINAAHEKRTLLMQAEMIGKIREGLYEVRDVRDQSTLLQFSEQDAQKQNFFAAVLPEQCLVEIIQRERSAGLAEADNTEQPIQIVMSMQIGGSSVMISLHREAEGKPWEVYDGRTRVKLGNLPDAHVDYGKGLVEEITNFLKLGHRHFLDALPVNTRRHRTSPPGKPLLSR